MHENDAEHRSGVAPRAAKLTGVREKTSLVRLGLEALIARESARRRAELGGSDRKARTVRRRRPARAA